MPCSAAARGPHTGSPSPPSRATAGRADRDTARPSASRRRTPAGPRRALAGGSYRARGTPPPAWRGAPRSRRSTHRRAAGRESTPTAVAPRSFGLLQEQLHNGHRPRPVLGLALDLPPAQLRELIELGFAVR